jgi:hypothetical protein
VREDEHYLVVVNDAEGGARRLFYHARVGTKTLELLVQTAVARDAAVSLRRPVREVVAQRKVTPDTVVAEEHLVDEDCADGGQKAERGSASRGRSALLAIHASVRIAALAVRPQFSIFNSGA